MKKIFITFVIIIMSIITARCIFDSNTVNSNLIKNDTINNTYGSSMHFVLNKNFNENQLDSLIKADTLDALNKWHTNTLTSFDNNQLIHQFIYIKKSGKNNIYYTVTYYKLDTLYKYNIKKIIQQN